jgi:hypothetical protein
MSKESMRPFLFIVVGIFIALLARTAFDHVHFFFTGEKKLDKEIWVAKEKTHAFDAAYDGNENILFDIEKGDICTPIKTYFEKVFLHTEVLCKNGQGWIVDTKKFDVIKAKEQKK